MRLEPLIYKEQAGTESKGNRDKSKDKRHVNFNKSIHLPWASLELLVKI